MVLRNTRYAHLPSHPHGHTPSLFSHHSLSNTSQPLPHRPSQLATPRPRPTATTTSILPPRHPDIHTPSLLQHLHIHSPYHLSYPSLSLSHTQHSISFPSCPNTTSLSLHLFSLRRPSSTIPSLTFPRRTRCCPSISSSNLHRPFHTASPHPTSQTPSLIFLSPPSHPNSLQAIQYSKDYSSPPPN